VFCSNWLRIALWQVIGVVIGVIASMSVLSKEDVERRRYARAQIFLQKMVGQ
jgi:hypothetical protein